MTTSCGFSVPLSSATVLKTWTSPGLNSFLQVDLDLDGAVLQQSPDQAVGLGRQEGLGESRGGEVVGRAGHADQAVFLVGVAQVAGGALLDHQGVEGLAEGQFAGGVDLVVILVVGGGVRHAVRGAGGRRRAR